MKKEGIFINGYVKVNDIPIQGRIRISNDAEKQALLQKLGITEKDLVRIQGEENTYFYINDHDANNVGTQPTNNQTTDTDTGLNNTYDAVNPEFTPTTPVHSESDNSNTNTNDRSIISSTSHNSSLSGQDYTSSSSSSSTNLSGNDNNNTDPNQQYDWMGGGSAYSHTQQSLNSDTSASLVFEAFGLDSNLPQLLNSNISNIDSFSAEFVALAGKGGNSIIIDIEGGASDGIIINIPALISGTDAQLITEDVNINGSNIEASGSLLINDPNGENSFVAGTYNGLFGTITLDANGNWIYSADNTQGAIQSLGAGSSLADTITITSIDGTTHDINITINGTNDAAVISGVDIGALTEDTGVVGNNITTSGTLTVTDVDIGEASFTAGTYSGTYGSVVIDSAGNWTYTADNTNAAIQSLGSGASVNDSITITSLDGTTHNITLTITGTNDVPVLGASSYVVDLTTMPSPTSFTYSDVDTGDTHTFSTDKSWLSASGGGGTGNISVNYGSTVFTQQISTLTAGTVNVTDSSGGIGAATINYNTGSADGNLIIGTTGDDTINGDKNTETINSSTQTFNDGTNINYDTTINYGGDIVHSGGGSMDLLYGDLTSSYTGSTLDAFKNAQANKNVTQNITYNFGGDITTSSAGFAAALGDAENIYLGTGDKAFAAQIVNGSGTAGLTNNLSYNFGNDTMSFGDGANYVYGDISSLNVGGSGAGSFFIGANNYDYTVSNTLDFNFGGDSITTGTGSDIIYGDMYAAGIAGGTYDFDNDAIVSTSTMTNTINMNFGGDNIDSGAGADTIYADAYDVNIGAGANAFANTGAGSSTNNINFTFGNDTVNAGDGNDLIVGDVTNLTIGSGANAFANAGSGSTSNNINITFGDDVINGGTGDDTIYGDNQNAISNPNNLTLNITGGNDTIDGGAGADTIHAGLGNDTITFDIADLLVDGGTGSDTLVVNDASVDFTASSVYNVVDNMEIIDLNNALSQTINLDVTSVQQMTELQNDLYVQGGTNDTVNLTGFTDTGSTVTNNGVTYEHYTDGSGTDVYVDTDNLVNLL